MSRDLQKLKRPLAGKLLDDDFNIETEKDALNSLIEGLQAPQFDDLIKGDSFGTVKIDPKEREIKRFGKSIGG